MSIHIAAHVILPMSGIQKQSMPVSQMHKISCKDSLPGHLYRCPCLKAASQQQCAHSLLPTSMVIFPTCFQFCNYYHKQNSAAFSSFFKCNEKKIRAITNQSHTKHQQSLKKHRPFLFQNIQNEKISNTD